MKPEKTEPTPEERARKLLEAGTSIRQTARLSGLSEGVVARLRIRLEGERAGQGLDPLPKAKPGPARVDLGVSVPSRVAAELDERARLEGLTREELVLRLLGAAGISHE